MPDFDGLARWLVALRKTPDATGAIVLSVADAICLRDLGFPTAVPGRWIVPSLPGEFTSRDLALNRFATNTSASPRVFETTGPRQDRVVPPMAPASAVRIIVARSTVPYDRDPLPLSARLYTARRDLVQRRILRSLARRGMSR